MHATGSGSIARQKSPILPPVLHVVLYQPEIPQNTGNIGRTCVALAAKLWIVRPTGFRLDDTHLRRAGLDYWQHLDWEAVDNWSELETRLPMSSAWLITKFAERTYSDANFAFGDILVIGRETNGLPDSLRAAHAADRQLMLPMPGPVRSLNQATCTGIVMYEAYRQISQSGTAVSDASLHASPSNAQGCTGVRA